MNRASLLLVLLLAQPLMAQTTKPDLEAIPKETLIEMYKRESPEVFKPELAEKLYKTHLLIEKYFAETSSIGRSELVKDIEFIGLEPNLVGRICRIRLYWPQLQGGVYYVNERVGPHQVIYFMGIPENYDRTRPWPLVFKLPAAHAFVTRPPPDADQVARTYTEWMRTELKSHPDAVCIMPLMHMEEGWGPSQKGMNSVIQPLYHAAARVNIDPQRVYIIGHDMAAHATWNLAVHYPTYLAAILPMAGGMSAPFQRLRMANLRNVLPVVWHDADDKVLKVDTSRDLVRQLRNAKYDVEYEETKLIGHAPSEAIFNRLYDKMRARSRDLYPREVVLCSNRPDSIFNRADWVQVYQPLSPGGEQKVRFRLGTGPITTNANPHKITATFNAPNRIQVKSENVESMRFYLNDQLVNFKRAIIVTVNGRVRFEGFAKPSIEDMLKDQVFLGRGWRYYTGFIDIDFGNLGATTRPATGPTTRKGIIQVIPDR